MENSFKSTLNIFIDAEMERRWNTTLYNPEGTSSKSAMYESVYADILEGLSVEFSVPHIDCPHCGSDSYKKNDGIESCENYLCDLNSPSNEQK